MWHVQARFEKLGESLSAERAAPDQRSLQDIARGVLPIDDSSFQWSPIGVGLATDPLQKMASLFNRMVMRYDEPVPTGSRRTVSFDMAAAETIRDKAHKLLGQITSVYGTAETFRLDMPVAKPADDALMPAFESALSNFAENALREGDRSRGRPRGVGRSPCCRSRNALAATTAFELSCLGHRQSMA